VAGARRAGQLNYASASKFDRVLSAVPLLSGRAVDWLRRLCDAALMDEDGVAQKRTWRLN
jgi:hypothetical protein